MADGLLGIHAPLSFLFVVWSQIIVQMKRVNGWVSVLSSLTRLDFGRVCPAFVFICCCTKHRHPTHSAGRQTTWEKREGHVANRMSKQSKQSKASQCISEPTVVLFPPNGLLHRLSNNSRILTSLPLLSVSSLASSFYSWEKEHWGIV